MILLVLFAFLAGIVTILSPCILPILPIILSSTIGGYPSGKSRPVGVVLGFVASFTFFTLFLSTIVRLSGIPADSLRLFSIIIIAGFGISLLIPQFQVLLERLFSKLSTFIPNSQGRSGFGGGLLIGLSLGLLWTPCVGPILASVISLAITGSVTFDAFIITLSYSLGTAIPMFVILLAGQNALKKVPWLLANTSKIQKAFGIIMILTAIAIFANIDRQFQTFIINTFPQYGVGLTKFEDNQTVRKQLENISGENIGEGDPPDGEASIGKPLFDSLKPKAPEIIPGGTWFNLPAGKKDLTLSELRGKVVIIDFWTYSCINCQRTLPYLRSWWEKYSDKGLVIIGVHSPEFEFEKNEKNVADAIEDFQLKYPIVQDNNFETWRAYNNRYWPAKYFIDKKGYIRYSHFGEGAYDESERVIQELLKETGAGGVEQTINNPTYEIYSQTPETYLGYERIDNFASNERIVPNQTASYTAPQTLSNNQIAYEGEWTVMNEYANPKKGAKLHINFESKEVFLVMRTKGSTSTIRVYVDGQVKNEGVDVVNGIVTINSDRLYKLVNLDSAERHTLMLEFEDDNTELYAFTFG